MKWAVRRRSEDAAVESAVGGGRVCSAVLAGPGEDAEIFGGGGMHILAKKFILIK